MAKKKRSKSVFRTIMFPLLALLLAEALLLSLVLASSGVIVQLNRNAEDILQKQVQNRASYLTTTFSEWADLQRLSDEINVKAQQMLDSGAISLDTLESDSATCAPLLEDITEDLISTLYAKRLTGIYVVFNTQDLSSLRDIDPIGNRTGVYLRDMDPTSTPSIRNEDLLWERCPISVVRSMDISTDSAWRPQYDFPAGEAPQDRAFFTAPLQAAYTAGDDLGEASDYGYWGPVCKPLRASPWSAITYSIPLILDDGTIYGVLGVEVLVSHLQSLLPYNELSDVRDQGSYLLAVGSSGADDLAALRPVLFSGPADHIHQLDRAIGLSPYRGGYLYSAPDGEDYYLTALDIPLYSSNTPFENQRWVLLGAVPTKTLYAFSNRVLFLLSLDILLMLVLGIVGSLLVSRRLSRQIHQLSLEVEEAQKAAGNSIPKLSETGITEIDQFSDAITALSRDVVIASTRFLQIIDLASVEIGGFEVRDDSELVYVTDNYLPMLGIANIPADRLTTDVFWSIQKQLEEAPTTQRAADGSILCQTAFPDGSPRYIRVETTQVPGGHVGVAEDMTASTLERLRAERERDYDLLTGLLSRRAFYGQAEGLFDHPECLGLAALVMMDLDNLKFFNDHYGHDCGDAYIRKAGECLAENAPANSICSRVSGDEFFLLIYGYQDHESLQQALDQLSTAFHACTFHPEGGYPLPVSASAGVAHYPQDATDFHTLMKYADFAMYQVKRVEKGSMGAFDLDAYNRENFMDQSRQEFLQLIRDEQVFFHFQPIVDAATGEIFAYEALMRTDLPTLHSPQAILKIAREMGRLQDIESLTFLRAPYYFRQFLKTGQAEPMAYLFVNSVASEHMSPRAIERFRREVGDFQSRIVVEITEADNLSAESIQVKRNAPGLSGLFALDDYGSGYSNERALLKLAPQFVKVDTSIIRDIDRDPDKRHIVANLVDYAHERGIRVVAEGVETISELTAVLELGVDLLQGYLLSRPAAIPEPIPQPVLDRIQAFRLTRR